jgi:hypothetical protein
MAQNSHKADFAKGRMLWRTENTDHMEEFKDCQESRTMYFMVNIVLTINLNGIERYHI